LRNGRWQATNLPLVGLIAVAWGIPGNHVFGAPDWARVTRYDIAAVAPASATQEQVWPMVQALLRDRFRVTAVDCDAPD
jgi:uncharacterized protein (TIGR03435 family)